MRLCTAIFLIVLSSATFSSSYRELPPFAAGISSEQFPLFQFTTTLESGIRDYRGRLEGFRKNILEGFNKAIIEYRKKLVEADRQLELDRSQGLIGDQLYRERHAYIKKELEKSSGKGEYMQLYFSYLDQYRQEMARANEELARIEKYGEEMATAVLVKEDPEEMVAYAYEMNEAPIEALSVEEVLMDLSPTAAGASETDYAVVRVFFATDRNYTGSDDPGKMFGGDRKLSGITYGVSEVSIPRDHRMGELEEPSIWRFEFRENPEKHVVLLRNKISSKDEFFADVATRVREFSKSSAFVFVHGYNVTFENAARRTAQISYDLAFEGAPVFYSWPSQGNAPAYTVDEQNIEWSQTNLRNFLEDFFNRSEAQNVYLVAHSMGNRGLTRALATLLNDKPDVRDRLKEVILTAPDIDAAVFKRDIAPALTAAGRPVTLYASSEDLALIASKKVHGYPRAGDTGENLIIAPGIETIDATGVDTSFLGHSYFAETRSALSDIYSMIRNGKRADQRFGLRGIESEAGRYWVFKQ